MNYIFLVITKCMDLAKRNSHAKPKCNTDRRTIDILRRNINVIRTKLLRGRQIFHFDNCKKFSTKAFNYFHISYICFCYRGILFCNFAY